MPQTRKSTRANAKSSPELDITLLKHLFSPKRYDGLDYLKLGTNHEKAVNRLKYFKRIRKDNFEDFIDICNAYGITNTGKESVPKTVTPVPSKEASDDDYSVETEIPPPKSKSKSKHKTKKVLDPIDMPSNTVVDKSHLGKLITCPLPEGLIFCIAWVESRLDPTIMKVVISDDGYSVLCKSSVPSPKSGFELVDGMYDWAHETNNVVNRHLNNIVKALKKQVKPDEKWESRTLIQFNEPVIKKFVDINGLENNEVKYKTDDDGRQRISFFVKTVNAHDDIPEAAKFVSCDNNNKMDTSYDSCGYSYSEETVGDVRAELDEKIAGVKDSLTDMFRRMAFEMKQDTANQLKSVLLEHQAEVQQQQQQAEFAKASYQADREAEAARILAGVGHVYPDKAHSSGGY